MRIAAIEVSHWHALHDAAYLKNAGDAARRSGRRHPGSRAPKIAAQRAAALGAPSVYTDYSRDARETRPDS